MRLLHALAVGLVAPAVGKGLSGASVPDASALTEPGDQAARAKLLAPRPKGASNCGLEGLVDAATQHGKSSCANIEPSQLGCEDYYTRHLTKSDRYTLCKPMDATNKTCGPGLAFGCTWTREELHTRSDDPSSGADSEFGPWMVPPGAEPGDYPDGQPAEYPMGVCSAGCVPEGTNPAGSNPSGSNQAGSNQAGSNQAGSNPSGTYSDPSKLKTASDGLTPGGFGDWPGGGTPIRAPTDDGGWEFCWCQVIDPPPARPPTIDDPYTWTNSVDCSSVHCRSELSADAVGCPADKIKEMMKKPTRKGDGSGCLMEDPCDANDRKAGFDCSDKDSNDMVDKSEMEAMLVADGAPKEMAEMMLDTFDLNGDGKLSEKEVNDVTVCAFACASK